MLRAKILNPEALLNDHDVLTALEFLPGEQTRLVIKLFNPQRKDQLRYIPASAATVTVYLPKKDGTNVELAMTKFTDDRSMWYVDIEEAVTSELAGGNVYFQVDELGDGSKITKGLMENALALVISGVSC